MGISFKDLSVLIAHKSQVAMGDVREILSILSDVIVEDQSIIEMLLENGYRRLEEKKSYSEQTVNATAQNSF